MNRREFLVAPLALTACATLSPRAGPDGWAGAEGAADIGSALGAQRILDIRSRADLDEAMRLGDAPKLLRVHGVIDLAGGRGAADFADPRFDFDAYCREYSPQAWRARWPSMTWPQRMNISMRSRPARISMPSAPMTPREGW